MKKYLLTVFGNFDSEKCEEIGRCMEPLVDSEHLKYQYRSGAVIFHFGSEFQMCDIHEFMDLLSPDLFDSFILSEWTDKVSVFMPDDLKEHLFDLDNDSEDMVLVPRSQNNKIEGIYDEDDEDDILTLLMNEVKRGLQTPSLDQLLDKMVDKGIESLTPYEKAILENYSKK